MIFPSFAILDYRIFAPPMFGTFIISQCGCLIKGFENWFTNIQLKAELENRNLRNELELLKSQINPHFLFNTLNNIDALIQKSSKDASKSLIMLSDILRYMIYETKTDEVPLNHELEYMRNYIDLQQLRFRNKDYISVSFPENCNNGKIAPILLIPFIENAFKYSYNEGKLPVIEIALHCNSSSLFFHCMNYYSKENLEHERTGGVGLENVKRRLELLYKGKYELKITDENNIFNVDLNIRFL